MTVNGTGSAMSDKEINAALEAIQQANDRAEASPDYARRVLVEEGVYTPDGELTKEFRG